MRTRIVDPSGEPAPAGFVGRGGGTKRQGLQHTQDLAYVPKFGGIQRANPKAPAQSGVNYAFPSQAQEGLSDRRSAHPQLAGQHNVPNSASCREIAALDLGEDAVIDLVTEGYA